MRYNISKKSSTYAERVVYEILKELKIPFKHRWIISGYEIDFLVDRYVIEIDGHEQDILKNNLLINLGFIPIHLDNTECFKENIKKIIQNYNVFNKNKSS